MSISIISQILKAAGPLPYSHLMNDEVITQRARLQAQNIAKTDSSSRSKAQIFDDCLLGCVGEEMKRQAMVAAGIDCRINDDGNLLIDTRCVFPNVEVLCDVKLQRTMPRSLTCTAWEFRNNRNLPYSLYYLGFSADGKFATYFGYAEAKEMRRSLKPEMDKYGSVSLWPDTGKEKRTGWVFKKDMHF